MKKNDLKTETSVFIYTLSNINEILPSLKTIKEVKITTKDMTGTIIEFTFNKPSRDLRTAASVRKHMIIIPTILGTLKKALKTSQLPENIIEVPKNKKSVIIES